MPPIQVEKLQEKESGIVLAYIDSTSILNESSKGIYLSYDVCLCR